MALLFLVVMCYLPLFLRSFLCPQHPASAGGIKTR